MGRAGLLSLAACAAVLSSCAEEFQAGVEGGVENLLLVTFDTTRADRIGCYGYGGASTPVLDALAAEGALFERCIAPAPVTLPSHATVLTGLQPYSHGARNNGTHKLGEEIPSIAGMLQEQGFATGAVTSAFVLDSRFGLDSGFDSYDDDLSSGSGQGNFGFAETIAVDTSSRALKWLERRGDERWFLWIHYFDPHADYNPPEPYRSRFKDELYDGEIAYTDAMFGDVIEHLRRAGELDETLVVVTSDHGEALGEHGETTHGLFIYDATTHVPLIMSHPRLPGGERIEGVVGLVDVAPTALDLLGVSYGADFDGRSLAGRMLSPGASVEERPAYSESMFPKFGFGWSELRSLRGDNWRYVRAPRPELYDLEVDPKELDDLSEREPALVELRAGELGATLPEVEAETFTRDGGGMDSEVEEALAALGYAGSDLGGEAEDGDLADPKDKIGDLTKLRLAEEAIAFGREEEAVEIYRSLIRDNPTAVDARNPLADLLWRMGEPEQALEVQREIVKLPGVKSANFAALAALEKVLGVGDPEGHLELAKACDPRDPGPWVTQGDILHGPADPEGAIAAYRRALEIDPRFAKAWVGISEIEASRRDPVASIRAAEEAIKCDPTLHSPWFTKGSMLAASGRPREAVPCLKRAAEIDPDHLQTRFGLVFLHNSFGERVEAKRQLAEAKRIDPTKAAQMASGNPAIAELMRQLP
ncbi:MAG: sulfatase-like hydrolase/transferase [Planctomycetes bacterium]|nr:sulfatase-like hydrolase/transferase [Planctomycetota bacterium]